MIIEVTERMARTGRPNSACECPIALAFGPHLAPGESVSVGANEVLVRKRGAIVRRGQLPLGAKNYVRLVDAGMPAYAFAFDFDWGAL